MKARSRLLRLQEGIFRSLKSEAERLVGPLPEPIVKYEKAYLSAFRNRVRRPKLSSRRELTERMRSADVTFIADYHTLGQAQRTALRLIQDVYRSSEKWVLGLEFVPSHRQAELDAYQSGLIDSEEFLEKIRYREEWGFPWANYAPLLEWAKRNGVRLLALNRPRELPLWRTSRSSDDLAERDRWAAGMITDLYLDLKPGDIRPKVVVLYGELHVGEHHLPRQLDEVSHQSLKERLNWVSVHQNNDSLYWKLAKKGTEHLSDVLQLDRRNFHVISSTPWNKLQSLVSWAEGVGSGPDKLPHSGKLKLKSQGRTLGLSTELDEDEFLCDLESDSLSRMQAYGEAISDFLRLPSPEFDHLVVQSVYSADFIDTLRSESRIGDDEKKLIHQLVIHNSRFFIPRTGLVYLGTPSSNGVAELAAIVVAKGQSTRAAFFGETTDSFFQSVMDQAFGFFGSLLVNPRRKCDLPDDHLQRFLEIRNSDCEWHERQARLFTLAGLDEQARFLERSREIDLKTGAEKSGGVGMATVSDHVFRTRGVSGVQARFALWRASRYLGKILGKLLHRALLQGDLSIDQIRELAWQASDKRWRPAEVRYWEWVSAVSSQPLPISKKQMI